VSGGTVAGRGEPANRCWGARGYADATIMCERCRVANQQIVGASRGRSSSELIRLSDAPSYSAQPVQRGNHSRSPAGLF
jgi:hypothetical protein